MNLFETPVLLSCNLVLNVLKYSFELFPGLVLSALSVHYCSSSNILTTFLQASIITHTVIQTVGGGQW